VAGGVPAQQQRSAVCIKLPWPEVRTLPDINKALNEIPLAQRERVAMNIHNEGHYLPRLLEVFSQCEDIDDREALSHLYSIIKCLIMMNDMQLVEQMVGDQFFWGVVGALEYDPDLAPKKAEHRSFLKVCGKLLLSVFPCGTFPVRYVICNLFLSALGSRSGLRFLLLPRTLSHF
jgi:Component of IIS longevity pathway SMK-1